MRSCTHSVTLLAKLLASLTSNQLMSCLRTALRKSLLILALCLRDAKFSSSTDRNENTSWMTAEIAAPIPKATASSLIADATSCSSPSMLKMDLLLAICPSYAFQNSRLDAGLPSSSTAEPFDDMHRSQSFRTHLSVDQECHEFAIYYDYHG